LNIYGEILSLNAMLDVETLPYFAGPTDESVKMLHYYQSINEILSPLHLKITQIFMDEGGYLQLKLNNGTKLQLGNEHILTKMHHFVKVYDIVVKKRSLPPKEIDLRYKKGLAIQW
jgi:cell division protein FtsQ